MSNPEEALNALPNVDEQLKGLDADGRVALLRRENKRLMVKLREKDAGLDIIRTAVNEAFETPLDVRIQAPPVQTNKQTEEEAVLHLTDIHFGKDTKTYNSTVAALRLAAAGEVVAEITQLRRSFARIDVLHLLLGGDMVEGEGEIFPGQAHEIDQDLIEQMIRFGPVKMAELIVYLLQTFPLIKIKGAPGNHGRQGKGSAKRNNADSIFYEIVRLLVHQLVPRDEGRVEWDLPFDRPPGDEWYASFKICDRWGGLLVHGDQVRGQLGFPWYGYGKKVAGWASCLPAFDYLFSGHFHTQASFDLHDRQVLSTGSTESDNSYAKENHASAGSPKQRLVFFNKRLGLLSDNPLHLAEREPRR